MLGFGIWGFETCRHLVGCRRRRDRIRRIGPAHSRQVMQRDTCAPAVGGRPDKKRQQHNHHRQAQHRMRTDHAEIDQDDDRGNGEPIADDDEGPRIPWITCEDQTADRTAFKLGPPGKQWPFAAVRAALAQPAPKRRPDQLRAGRRHTQKLRARVPTVCASLQALQYRRTGSAPPSSAGPATRHRQSIRVGRGPSAMARSGP